MVSKCITPSFQCLRRYSIISFARGTSFGSTISLDRVSPMDHDTHSSRHTKNTLSYEAHSIPPTMLEKFIFGKIYRKCSNTLLVNKGLKANSLNSQQLIAPRRWHKRCGKREIRGIDCSSLL